MNVDLLDLDEMQIEIRRLAEEREAVVLAHNYQVPEIQDVADHVGDSLELARIAAATDAQRIVLCGVYFMAETAKILAPEKQVLIPDAHAGCSLAESITSEQLRTWKREHPDALVVMYVNTSAEVKAESDYCCTSSNAAAVVASIPEEREILFGPDMFLAADVERQTGRNLKTWMGECHVHAGISPADIKRQIEEHPDAEVHIHPECGCTSHALYLHTVGDLPADRTFVLSTGGMVKRAAESSSSEFIVATETGMLHRLRAANPEANFLAANEGASCRYMKMITLPKLLDSLRHDRYEVGVPSEVVDKARLAIERMVAIS